MVQIPAGTVQVWIFPFCAVVWVALKVTVLFPIGGQDVTVITVEEESVQPRASVATSVAVYVPGVEKDAVVLEPEAEEGVPPGKVQL